MYQRLCCYQNVLLGSLLVSAQICFVAAVRCTPRSTDLLQFSPCLLHISHPINPELVLWLGECPNAADLECGPLRLSTATAGKLAAM